MKARDVVRLVVAILICEMAGVVGSVFTISSIPTWYTTIAKPNFTPPSWLFGPVWVSLFLLIGMAVYIIWSKGTQSARVKIALGVFGLQLILNVLWSYVFFGAHLLFVALVEIVILWAAIAWSIAAFFRVSRSAGLLLIPYICWVTVATALTYYVWILNP